MFGSDCELRWVSRGQGEFDAWLLREYKRDATPARLHALNVEKSIRNYYLLGLATDLRGEFREARYPDALFVYPIELNFDDPVQAERTRAFVEVAEYRRSAPTWDSLSDISQINDLLDAPLLVAHRFVTIRSDRRPAR